MTSIRGPSTPASAGAPPARGNTNKHKLQDSSKTCTTSHFSKHNLQDSSKTCTTSHFSKHNLQDSSKTCTTSHFSKHKLQDSSKACTTSHFSKHSEGLGAHPSLLHVTSVSYRSVHFYYKSYNTRVSI
jgi:hypothetical protein